MPRGRTGRVWLAAKDWGMLRGFGIFNVVEGIVDHQLVGIITSTNRSLASSGSIGPLDWVWGAAMLVVGWLLLRSGKAESPGERTPI